jgi:HlyD family secretion protein
VLSREGQSVVFLLDGDRVMEKAVRTGRRMDTMVEILEGLGAGGKVVLSPGSNLRSGTRVRIPEK